MIESLIQSAEARGYRIRWHRGGPKAAWLPHRSTITLRVGMDDTTTLCSLAHELGHAHYGDPPGHHGAGPDPQMVDTLKPASRWGSEVPFHHATQDLHRAVQA